MAIDTAKTLRGALAGAVAAGVWVAQQPLDKRVFRVAYDDTELLGKLVTRRRAPARVVGTAIHLANGALFGAMYANAAPRLPLPSWSRGPAAAMVENFGLWPLAAASDRFHPARKELPRLAGNRAALAQATWRHLLFGVILGELERRLNAPADEETTSYEHVISSNGHGSLEHVVGAS
ncbi:MAG: hypothetical protein JWP17_1200 [Solirubrobacterales bacterium]|jgi:hypothetical protein|nr:hypothetical protein [Solirubrobacterales bacterium]